ncbi:MAG TPA: serine hydrolase [Fimbriimonadaceae bacterium]|nr:serine hydrolase [Fimbriimonadaceae bacterium]
MLQAQLAEAIEKSGIPRVGLAFDNLAGTEILINADDEFHPASTMKVPVMMEAYRRGIVGQSVKVKNEFASIADGSPYALNPDDDSETTLYDQLGQSKTVKELIVPMIAESSNLATNILVEFLGAEKITGYMEELGAGGMIVKRGVEDGPAYRLGMNNVGTARSFAALYSRLAKREVDNADEMLQILYGQKHNEALPAKLPKTARVAHKTGWNNDLYHDGGLIKPEDEPAFILCVYTQGAESKEAAEEFVADLAELCFEATRGRST